ncbi:MAG: hypothetical protein FJ008_09935 [Chloroflexi bacterium]|nr:hypothetical protein [Chloroflexota bacterium]MBM3176233.1 hypothetical protein [Chloroflexota bacterium]
MGRQARKNIRLGNNRRSYHRFIYPWDIAPGLLLVKEAGGIVTDWQGNPATLTAARLSPPTTSFTAPSPNTLNKRAARNSGSHSVSLYK